MTKETEKLPSGFAVKFATITVGKPIDPVIATSMEYLMKNKLADKPLADMLDKYDTPSNAKAMMVPKVNPPVWDSLKNHTRNNDLKLQKVQKLLVKGMIAMTKNLEKVNEDEQNGLTCLAAASFELNMLRRELIKPGLQEKFAQLCKAEVPITENLFGNDLSKHIKDLSEVHRATAKVSRGQRFSPYGRGRGYRGRGGASFLGRGGYPPKYQYKTRSGNSMLTTRRGGRGRGAGRGQHQ